MESHRLTVPRLFRHRRQKARQSNKPTMPPVMLDANCTAKMAMSVRGEPGRPRMAGNTSERPKADEAPSMAAQMSPEARAMR